MKYFSAIFVYCPFCGKKLYATEEDWGSHRQCTKCDRCMACEEKAARSTKPLTDTPATASTPLPPPPSRP